MTAEEQRRQRPLRRVEETGPAGVAAGPADWVGEVLPACSFALEIPSESAHRRRGANTHLAAMCLLSILSCC